MNQVEIEGQLFVVGRHYKFTSIHFDEGYIQGKLVGIQKCYFQLEIDTRSVDLIKYYVLVIKTASGEEFHLDSDLISRMIENELVIIRESEAHSESQVAVAIQFALDGMFTDGAHHKQWYLNQIVKTLMSPGEYAAKVVEMAPDYGWDEGLAP